VSSLKIEIQNLTLKLKNLENREPKEKIVEVPISNSEESEKLRAQISKISDEFKNEETRL
jgi:hypothetical protein